jgi:signal transduction histidine kinase/ligand-binding sensor domain-containing protein
MICTYKTMRHAMFRRGKTSVRRVLTVLVAVFISESAAARSPVPEGQRILHQSWTFKDGAPESVLSFAQTADGYLWLGTLTGLFRFDGSRFELFRPNSGDPLPWTDVPTLFAPRTGGLWIGYRYGGFSFLKNGRLTNYTPEHGPATVHGFAQDRHGIVWAATWNGLWRFDGSSWQPNPAGWEKGLQAAQVGLDRDGTLWVLTADKGVGVGRQLFYLLAGGANFQKAAEHLFAVGFTWDADYTILTTRERAAGELASGALLNGSLPAYPILKKSSDQVLDRNNGIWFIPRDPFILRRPAGEPLAEIVGTASPDNSQMYDVNPYRYARFVDRDGGFWLGDHSGLHRFSYTPLIEAPLPKTPETGFTVAPDDAGVVWISNGEGNGTSTLHRVAGDRAEFRGRQRGPVAVAYRAPDKTLWLGGAGGLVHMVAGHLQEIRLPPEIADKTTAMLSITQDRSGGIWLSLGGDGLYLLKDGTWTKLGGHRELIPGCLIEFTDSVGRVWFGSKANRIEMLDGDRVRVFGPADGLQVGSVFALAGRGPEIWVGGELGLEHFEGGRFRAIRSVNKEWLRGISGIVERANGDLWLNGLGGIIHLRRAEIVEALKNPAYEVGGERLGRREGQPGLPSQLGRMPTAIEGTDGRLWFTGQQGVVWLDPSRESKRTPPPSVTIESFSADDKGYGLDLPIRLPPHTASVQISYAAVSLSDPEAMRFRYKLRETDTDWHESATSTVSYRNLPPGTYHFVVNASDTNGLWSNNTATSEFIVLPAFYQTNWFRALCAAAFLGLLWAGYEFRVRQLQREFSMTTEARLNERTRIARDLHDTLLQSVQGLMFSFQAARNLLPDRTDEAIRTLDHAIGEGDAAIAEGRDAIQGLRADPALTSDLENLLTAAGKELARSSTATGEPPAFRVIVEGGLRSLSPTLQDEVYRIAREILRNAFQHAHAGRIEAEIAYDPQFLRLRIRDNGKGIDSRVFDQGARPGHWGLPGVRERAKRIGAQMKLWSEPGAGTEAELTVPARIAYRTVHRRQGLKLFRRNKV